ncbi:Uncharacterised protein [Sebaldella termitidis]|uniref:Uncharacterized protein n=1 Tax=Sebaldella termitidis (strain ATCC 33386 / NCTC 11300) TaxID=526218 RepID=D1AN53_SEBTE|nr:hypothetical protein [Sebaldella termitidis]ACZ09657.1 hypothetical protein Sterm_2813 [Sebaldella termitidis ATCC 33386]SUI24989.1 Uncharacterised protein [Sebaldella termitidis]
MENYYYFFKGIRKTEKIWEWFEIVYGKNPRVELIHVAPVTFSVDNTVYTIRYKSKWDKIYCIRLHGRDSHNHCDYLLKIEKFLNKLKETAY